MRPAFAAVLAAAWAAPAAALVPPLPVAVTVVERPDAPRGSGARMSELAQALESEQTYIPDRADIAVKKVRACGRSEMWESCIRRLLTRPRDLPIPVNVAVVLSPAPHGQVRMTCIGPGRRGPLRPPQTAYIDLAAALGEPAFGTYRQRANACIMGAVAERGF